VTGLPRTFRAEWFRLGRRAALLLPAAAVLGGGYAFGLAVAVQSGVLGARSGFYLAAAACSGAAMTCAVVGALAAASGVAADLAGGLTRTVLSRPVDRGAWVAGRVLALGAGVGCLFACACLGATAAGLLRFGLHGAIEGDYVISGAGFLGGQLAVAAAISFLGQLAAVALGGALGAALGRPGAAVLASALGGAALLALGRWPAADRLLPLAPVTAALDRVALLAQGIAAPRAADGALAALAVCLAWLVLGLALAVVALRRGDIVT
jgi:hypothetical protein